MESGRTIALEIITPDETVYSGDINFLVARATDGEIGILPHHAPLVAALATWPLRIETAEGTKLLAVFGGFLEVDDNNKITIITPNCERAETIDAARAERARERAEARLHDKSADVDMIRAEAALKRAVTRLKVVGKIN